MRNLLVNLVRDEEGQGMVEYGLIIALIAVALIATLQTTKGKIGEVFGRVDAGLDSAKPQ